MAARTAFFLVAVLTFGSVASGAQGPALPIPIRVETLASAKVGEPREFWVSLPDRYDQSTEKYPVLYMMDGDMNFNSGVIGGVRQAAWLGEIPEFIIVGIKNTNRSKDIFPEEVTYPDGSKDGGRADRYLDFVRDELIPRVAKTYRTTDYRVLYGTSNTGFTAVHALFRTPDLANAYIAASATLGVPSFRSARDQLVRAFKGGRRDLVLVMGEHDLPTVVSLNGALKETIATEAPAGLTCRLRVIENGEHVPPDALVQGLRVLFEGWKVARPLGENKTANPIEVLEYRAISYPPSAGATLRTCQAQACPAFSCFGHISAARGPGARDHSSVPTRGCHAEGGFAPEPGTRPAQEESTCKTNAARVG